MKEKKLTDWSCRKRDPKKNNGMELECSSKRGKELSIFSDGSIRVTQDNYPIKVNGKKIKVDGEYAYGVEL